MTKKLNGKALYSPTGKAGEYAQYAVNFHVGCSNNCTYCYLKKGVGKNVLGGTTPTLKKCFKNEEDALNIFIKEINNPTSFNDIKKHGVFFTFSSDPCLPETFPLNRKAILYCLDNEIPVKILTKCVDWIKDDEPILIHKNTSKYLAVGFTITGCDDEEPNAPSNGVRVVNLNNLKAKFNVKTFVSVEPMIDILSAVNVIGLSLTLKNHPDLFKIGLLSGKKDYNKKELLSIVEYITKQIESKNSKVYWKKSVVNYIGSTLPINSPAIVEYDYNLFES